MISVDEIVEKWAIEQPKYNQLGTIVCEFIREKITEYELFPEINYRTKELVSIIKKIKKKQSEKEYSYEHLKDKLGIRIICHFQEELEIVDKFIKDNFKDVVPEYKNEKLEFDKLDYVSNHYDVKLNISNNYFDQCGEYEKFIFEIQVRTVNQHTWSNTSHSLSYKQEKDLPFNLKRKIYRLLSIYELADDEFSSVNLALKNNYDELPYKLLRILEGKFYKFAKIDFDREISIREITVHLNFLPNEFERGKLIDKMSDFILEHEFKIRNIFSENRKRLHEYIYLTQPEIFITWYLINNNPFLISDNWCEFYENEDLEQIKVFWGNDL